MKNVKYTWNLLNATVNEHPAEGILAPNEFLTLDDCYAEGRSIRPRERTHKLSAINVLPQHSGMHSLFNYTGPNGENWLVAALTNHTDGTAQMVAFVLTFSSLGSGATVGRVIVCPGKTQPAFLPFSYVVYRGYLYASNGFDAYMFTGQSWYGPSNNMNTNTPIGRYFSFAAAIEFEAKMLVGCTPNHRNEITHPVAGVDVPLLTQWTGTEPTGGTQTVQSLYGIGNSGSTLVVVGGEGTMLRSTTNGKTWSNVSPTIVTMRAVELGSSASWAVGGEYLLGFHVLKSTDTGVTWSNIGTPAAATWNALAFHDSDNIVIGGEVGQTERFPTTYYTVDGGDNWVGVGVPAGLNAGPIRGLAKLNSTFPTAAHAIAACEKKDGLIGNSRVLHWVGSASPDWAALDSGTTENLNAAATVDLSHGVIVGDAATIILATWPIANAAPTIATITPPGGVTANLYGVHFSGNRGWAVGAAGTIITSADGGLNWVEQSSGVSNDLYSVRVSDILGRRTIYACGANGAFIFSVDDGATWTDTAHDPDANLFSKAVYLQGDEEIRSFRKRSGLLYVFTDRGVRTFAYDGSGLAEQSYFPDIEVFNEQSVQEYAGAFWFIGKWRGRAGIWAWGGGSDTPKLMSQPVEDTVAACSLQPSPGKQIFKWHGKQAFTKPTVYEAGNAGIQYSNTEWLINHGQLIARPGASLAPVFSHGLDANPPISDVASGLFIPSVTNWGFMAIEVALNDTGDSVQNTKLDVSWGTSPDDPDNPGHPTQGSWVWRSAEVNLPHTEQGKVPGRFVLRVDEMPAANEWFQWQLRGTRTASKPSNLIVNSVTLTAFKRSGQTDYTGPFMLEYDDKLFVFLDDGENGKAIVYSNGGQSVTVASYGSDWTEEGTISLPASATTHLDRMAIAMRDSYAVSGRNKLIYTFPDPSVTSDQRPALQSITTGWIDFSENDPEAALKWKRVDRIRLVARAVDEATSPITLSYYTDSDTDISTKQSIDLTLYRNPAPLDGNHDRHIIELHAPPTQTLNFGKRFKFILVGDPTTANDERRFVLEGFQVEATLLDGEKATSYQT